MSTISRSRLEPCNTLIPESFGYVLCIYLNQNLNKLFLSYLNTNDKSLLVLHQINIIFFIQY